jgi:hypothetical protein
MILLSAIGTTILSLSWSQMILGLSGLTFVYVRQSSTFNSYNCRIQMKEKKKRSHARTNLARSIRSFCLQTYCGVLLPTKKIVPAIDEIDI